LKDSTNLIRRTAKGASLGKVEINSTETMSTMTEMDTEK
jgi:hypothetical protein